MKLKSRILSALFIILFSAACNGSIEIGLEHPPSATATLPVMPTTTLTSTASPSPVPTATLQDQTPTATATDASTVYTVKIFLIAIGDNGQGGLGVGCGDSVIPVQIKIPPTQGVMKAALGKLLSLKDQHYGESGLYNALFQSDLKVESINISAGKASVYLTGSLTMGGECDNPRVQAQLEQTVLQFPTTTEADIFINGKPLADALSLK